MEVVRPRYSDPFGGVMVDSQVLEVSDEQKSLIKMILDVCCSDSQFADKAYKAITRVLTGGSVVVPEITSLNPGSATIGDPSFTLHVMGSGFLPGSIIVFAGVEEPTTHVSDSEITTGVNMDVWMGPDSLPVMVKSPDGVLSEAQMFVFSAASSGVLASPSIKASAPTPAIKSVTGSTPPVVKK